MDKASTPDWAALFEGSTKLSKTRSMVTLLRRGHEFLYLPNNARASRHAMQMYPAQTRIARAARCFISTALRFRLAFTLPHRSLQLTSNTSFATFLKTSARTAALGEFAVLVGNPNASGTRFIFLLFDENNSPACVVKAGTTSVARELVRRECGFLQKYSRLLPALPLPLGYSETEDYAALALPFIDGTCPQQNDGNGVAKLLGSWISHDEPIPLGTVPAWQNLPQDDETFRKIKSSLAVQMVRPVLMHGDFAPWNIKVAKDGSHTALDWERGEFPGVPSWDWFHYIVQTSILVRHDSPHQTMRRLQRLFTTSPFQSHAQQAGITNGLLGILAGYLLHNKMHGLSGDAESIDQISRLVMQELGN
jgi:hypothetical protein